MQDQAFTPPPELGATDPNRDEQPVARATEFKFKLSQTVKHISASGSMFDKLFILCRMRYESLGDSENWYRVRIVGSFSLDKTMPIIDLREDELLAVDTPSVPLVECNPEMETPN